MDGHRARNLLFELTEKWRSHRSSRAALAELDACGPAEVAEIARDARVDPAELRDIVARGIGAELLMERMLSAYDIDIGKLKSEAPSIMRDVSILCSKCDAKGRCRRELAAGTARQNANEFCPNHESFEAIAKGDA